MRAFLAPPPPLPGARTQTQTQAQAQGRARALVTTTTTSSMGRMTPRALPGGEGVGPSLYDVLLPGTHDSAAYTARPDLLSRTAPPVMAAGAVRALTARTQSEFALTQHLSIRGQLDAGARFLDLRVSKRAGTPENVDEFWTVHGMVLCVPLDDIVAQLNAFEAARANSGTPRDAPVVLAVRCYALSAREAAALGRVLVGQLRGGVFVGDSSALSRVPIVDLPPFVLAGVSPSRLSAEWGADVWTDTYCSTKKIAFLEEALASAKRKTVPAPPPPDDGDGDKTPSAPANLLVLGWTVTPNVVDVALRFVSWGILRRTVMEEALDMNDLFDDFAATRAFELREKANVVFFDCFTEREAMLVRRIAEHSHDPMPPPPAHIPP